MLQAIALMLFGLISFMGIGNAAVLITSDDQGKTATDVFDNQVYYRLEDGNLLMRIDLKKNRCSMFIHEENVQIEDKCDDLQKNMESAMSSMLEQQGLNREAMTAMRQMMAQRHQQEAKITPAGAETIAGYQAACYQMSATRTMCISEDVMKLISREFDVKKMGEIMRHMSGGPMDHELFKMDEAEHKLREQGYVMKDVDQGNAMPNANMIQMLPEDVRKQMMEQMQQSAGQPTGQVVVNIEKDGNFVPEMPNYPKKSIREFANSMMSR